MAGPDQQLLTDGTLVDGKYEILAEIGSGTFGRVYRARQLTTGQHVAFKAMRFADDLNEDAIQNQISRFDREMQLCAELSHPNLVGLVDSGELETGRPYAVFEFVPGETLADILVKEVRLAPREAVRLMGQILDALAAAHRNQVVHRDLKPANIMIGGTGAVRNATLLDLGLGGFVEGRREEMRRLTASREFAGTIDYAAPEQLFGANPSERSDLYAWGLVLYECLVGEHAFETGHESASLLDRRAVRIPDSLAAHPIGSLIARVTEPDPVHRNVDAETLMRELDQIDVRGLDLAVDSSGKPDERETRRQISVVSCRLEVGTSDLEPMDRAHRKLHDIATEAATHYGGSVASMLGERVILYFGYPAAHENDARRAARAGLEIVREVNAQSGKGPMPGMSIHVGVHAGPVITRESMVGSATANVEIVGSTSVVATHLDELAPAGEVVLSDTAQRLLGPSMQTEPFGTHRLRGASGEQDIHLLLPSAPSALSSRVGQPGFVGRDRQLRHLLESWQGAEAGNAECIVVRGDPGIGKSRLLRELRSRLDRTRWLECRCLEEWSDSPLRPIIDLLGEFGVQPEALFDAAGADTASALPLLENLMGLRQIPGAARQALSPDREKSILLFSLASVLVQAGQDAPTVISIEDLHWADPTTRELITAVVQRIESDPKNRLLILLSTREWMPQGASVIQLPTLSETEVARMVEGRLTNENAPTEALVRQVVERADGIPLFVEEVTRVLRDANLSLHGSGVDELIPDSLEALLQARLDTLSEATREVTQVAAAIGREFEIKFLRHVTHRSEGALRSEMDELVRKGIVLHRPSADGEQYAFRHALIREAAWNSMVPTARHRCHGRIVEHLERDYPGLEESEPETLAHHLWHAAQYARSAVMWHRAGRRALANATYQEGINLLERGLRVLSLMEETKEKKHIEVQLLETLGMGFYSTLGYSNPKVLETFERAESVCYDLGEAVPLQTLYGVWGVRFAQGAIDETASLVQRFRELKADSDEPLAALYAHGTAGLRAAVLGDFPLADEQLGLSTLECETFVETVHLGRLPYGGAVHPPSWWAWVQLMRGKPTAADETADRMRSVATHLDKAYGYALAGHFAALLATELDDIDLSHELAQRQMDFSTEQQIMLWQLCSQCLRGWAVARLGEPKNGANEIGTCLAVLTGIGMLTGSSPFYALQAEAELMAGDANRALEVVDAGMRLGDATIERLYRSPLQRVRGLALLAKGQRADAEEALRGSIKLAEENDAGWFILRTSTDLAQLLGENGRREEGHALLETALARIEGGAEKIPVRRARDLATALA